MTHSKSINMHVRLDCGYSPSFSRGGLHRLHAICVSARQCHDFNLSLLSDCPLSIDDLDPLRCSTLVHQIRLSQIHIL